MNFLNIKGPELLNMYVGESEKNVRDVFERARKHHPCIIFFDEIDSLLPKRGGGGDSSGVMDRLVAQFLTEVDTCQKDDKVFIIAATNRPDLLDPSMLTPGRFDKKVYLGIANDQESRINVLEAQTRKIKLAEDVSFYDLEKVIPQNLTGADFSALVSQAYLAAIGRYKDRLVELVVQREEVMTRRSVRKVLGEIKASDFDEYVGLISIQVNEADFLGVVGNVKPSVSEADLKNYEKLQGQFAKGG
jgi:peroxin-6